MWRDCVKIGLMNKPSLLIVKTGSSLPGLIPEHGDFEHWFMRGLGHDLDYRTVAVFEDKPLPAPGEIDAVLVTGSPAMVSHRADWSERTAGWLKRVVDANRPVLGVCYGHQLLAHALGGRVGPNPHGRQIGTVKVTLDADGDPLLGDLGGARCFQTTHIEVVLEPAAGTRMLASTPADPHYAFRLDGRDVWGVQFHPEFSAEIMTGYIRARAGELEAEGFDVPGKLAAIRPAPAGDRLLACFAEIVRDRAGWPMSVAQEMD